MKNSVAKFITRTALIAGLYILSTLIVFPVASGAIQFRISEALCLLPLVFIDAVPGLFIGCLLSNLITGCSPADVLLGSVITLTASILTFFVGKMFKNRWLKVIIGGLFPVILNALFLPLIWLLYGAGSYVYMLEVAFVFIGQTVSVYLLGIPMYFRLEKLKQKGRL
ncbi:MAG: QueT transporter family protein [Clostridia bacterium]|nr:QueT transporter family protein [Clostridia bacterium]